MQGQDRRTAKEMGRVVAGRPGDIDGIAWTCAHAHNREGADFNARGPASACAAWRKLCGKE